MRVLVAEDNKESRYLMEKMLQGYGHEVTAVANGAEALEQALAQQPDIIVSDIMMPKMDGFQLCQECKQNEQLKNIPFIFYTATYTSDEDEKFALSLGANAFILKPTEPDIFIQKLCEVFEKAKSHPLAPDKVTPLEPSLYLTEYNKRIVAKLEQKMAELEIEIAERKQAEEALAKRTYDLGERIKELNCLYGISKFADKQDISLEEIAQGIVNFIPPGCQYPEITCARVIMKGQEFRTENFRETIWKQASDIIVHGDRIGILEVSYLEEKPESDEGPFLKEEKDLIIAITERLGRIIERHLAEDKIREYSENLEAMVEERTKELDRALYDTEEARDRIDGILKSVADGLIVTDIYNRIILMNPSAEDLLGVRLSEVINRPIDLAIQDKTLRDRIKNTLEKKKTDYQFDFELPVENAKHPRIMRARTSGIKDKTGTHAGIITIIHDVTHEREVDRMKTEFISTAAHEFRTPLTSIQGFSEILLMRENLKPEEKKKFLTHINNQAVSLANIVNDLLDISRIESSLGFSLNKVPCNMADIIRGSVLQFQEQTSKHYFEVILPEESVGLKADKEKMEQIFINLLGNAVKYSPEGGTICLSAKKILHSAIEISIADQGIGMTPEQVEKIFDKFYRADASDTATPGTGLGMSIVKYIVEAHGGKVWVESEFGKGTTVRFAIPT